MERTFKEIKKEDLKKISKIIITDYSNYDESYSRDGGAYWFSTDYRKIGKDRWEVSYDTSAQGFSWNYTNGRFEKQLDNDKYETVDDATILAAIERTRGKNNLEVRISVQHLQRGLLQM